MRIAELMAQTDRFCFWELHWFSCQGASRGQQVHSEVSFHVKESWRQWDFKMVEFIVFMLLMRTLWNTKSSRSWRRLPGRTRTRGWPSKELCRSVLVHPNAFSKKATSCFCSSLYFLSIESGVAEPSQLVDLQHSSATWIPWNLAVKTDNISNPIHPATLLWLSVIRLWKSVHMLK